MQTTLGDVTLNVSPAPAFMGHEEIVIPMLVFRSSKWREQDKLGGFWHCTNPKFQPNDLSNTAIVGYTSGRSPGGVGIDSMFIGRRGDAWHQVQEINDALDNFGSDYAFFMEASESPFQDGFVHRCRFIAQDRLHDFRPSADLDVETRQAAPARDALSAFLREFHGEPDYQRLYGDHYESPDFYDRFGSSEQFRTGYAIWLEGEGVLRAWTRIVYIPK